MLNGTVTENRIFGIFTFWFECISAEISKIKSFSSKVQAAFLINISQSPINMSTIDISTNHSKNVEL